jgi:sterol desaturase/sphingolipid hydroxylase (fatty acid hydroxylase superfamily)
MEQGLLLEYESTLPLSVLALSSGVIAVWESWAPRRSAAAPLRTRWLNNVGIWLLASFLVRWTFPALGVAFAVVVAERGWGLLQFVPVPSGPAVALSILALDLQRYVEHWLFHHVPALWRIHRVHHTDTGYDFTLGLRFHPAEALVTAAASLAVVGLLGVPPLAVLAYQALSLASSVFSHANIRVPGGSEGLLRHAVVTPDMHRIHHSAAPLETNSNLGNLFPWWDHLFGTYVGEPAAGHERMVIGLERFRELRDLMLPRMLVNPFIRE